MSHKISVSIISLLMAAQFSISYSQEDSKLAFFPRCNFGASYQTFKLQKNDQFKEKYLSESNFYIDVSMINYSGLSLNFFSEQNAGMGESHVGLVFHPRDINFCLNPYLNYSFSFADIFSGLDHRCFHEIDKNEEPTIYWNKFFIGISSKNAHLADFTKNLSLSNGWSLANYFSWSLTWGYYLRDFFGMVAPIKMMAPEVHYIHDFLLNTRFGVFHYKNSIVNLTGSTLLGATQSENIYFCQQIGIEANFNIKKFYGSAYVNYVRDNHLNFFDSKDKLLELGLRLYK